MSKRSHFEVIERKAIENGLRGAVVNLPLSRTSMFGANAPSRRERELRVLERLEERGIGYLTVKKGHPIRFTLTDREKLLQIIDVPVELSKLIWPQGGIELPDTDSEPDAKQEQEEVKEIVGEEVKEASGEDQEAEKVEEKIEEPIKEPDPPMADKDILLHILTIMTNMAESVIRIRDDVDVINRRVEALAKEWQIK